MRAFEDLCRVYLAWVAARWVRDSLVKVAEAHSSKTYNHISGCSVQGPLDAPVFQIGGQL